VCYKKYLPSNRKNINTQIARKSLELLDGGLETVAQASRLFSSLIYAPCLVFVTKLRAAEPSCCPSAAETRKTGEYAILEMPLTYFPANGVLNGKGVVVANIVLVPCLKT
jgi:hypothetical protein